LTKLKSRTAEQMTNHVEKTPLEELAHLVEKHKDEASQEIPVPQQLIERILTAAHETDEHLQRAQKQLMQSEKMATLGQMMAGIAHEINTPVASINSNIGLFTRSFEKIRMLMDSKKMLKEDRQNRQMMRIITTLEKLNHVNTTACSRIVQISRSLRDFTRVDEMELRETDLHEALESALVLAHHEIKRRIEVIREYGDIPKCPCCPNQLSGVFLNLIINASHAIEGKGKIFIKTFKDEDAIKIQVTDTGKGIPPEHLEKIFGVFTTKPPGKGTGLGLLICQQIIEKYNGKIEVESEVGVGSTFTITLPTQPKSGQN